MIAGRTYLVRTHRRTLTFGIPTFPVAIAHSGWMQLGNINLVSHTHIPGGDPCKLYGAHLRYDHASGRAKLHFNGKWEVVEDKSKL